MDTSTALLNNDVHGYHTLTNAPAVLIWSLGFLFSSHLLQLCRLFTLGGWLYWNRIILVTLDFW